MSGKIHALNIEVLFQDVLQDIRSTFRGDYKDLCTALLQDQATQDAELLNYSVKGLGTNEMALIHILASRSAQVCRAILDTDPVAMTCNSLLKSHEIMVLFVLRELVLRLLP